MALSPSLLESRAAGYALLRGQGIEIGALHEPAALPAGTQVTYVDALTHEQARALFPEVDPAALVVPTVITNLDQNGLGAFPTASVDFVVICHVLEHLANPLRGIAEVFRVLRPGGRAVIAVPDKRFTFDRPRTLTPFLHLWQDYLDGITDSPDDHYYDFLRAVVPGIVAVSPEERRDHVGRARARREHAHVWDSASFQEALLLAVPLTGYRARLLFESIGDANQFEYFSVWEKR